MNDCATPELSARCSEVDSDAGIREKPIPERSPTELVISISRQHRRIILAIIGIVIGGLIVAVGYGLHRAAEAIPPTYIYQPAINPGFRIDHQTRNPTEQYNPTCNNPSTRQDAELCAEWAAVAAVGESNRLASGNLQMAILSMLLTSVATGFLVWTFYETRKTSRRELRAYLCLRPVVMEKIVVNSAPTLTITLPIENTGSTPANHWQIQWAWQVTDEEPTAKLFNDLMEKYPLGDEAPDFSFGPKQIKENTFKITIGNDWRDKVISGGMKFYFLGRIHYVDAFSTKRVTEFFYYYTEDLPNRMGQVQFNNRVS